MTDEEYSAYQTDEAGQTIGIGVTVQQNEDGYLQVVSVSDDSPAKDAGIQADDVILKVGEDDVAELGYAGAVAQVRGEAGTTVTLTIQRGDQTKELEVERRSMDVITAQGKMLDGNIGYIRISAFKGNTRSSSRRFLTSWCRTAQRRWCLTSEMTAADWWMRWNRFWIRCCRRVISPSQPIGTARPRRW